MKKIFKYGIFAIASIGVGGITNSAQAVDLSVVSWGGAYTASQMNAYHKPYMKKNPGVKINSIDYSGGLAQMRAQTEARNVTWD